MQDDWMVVTLARPYMNYLLITPDK